MDIYVQMSIIESDARGKDDLGRREAEVVCFQAAFECLVCPRIHMPIRCNCLSIESTN